jgi:hypothetical protein
VCKRHPARVERGDCVATLRPTSHPDPTEKTPHAPLDVPGFGSVFVQMLRQPRGGADEGRGARHGEEDRPAVCSARGSSPTCSRSPARCS